MKVRFACPSNHYQVSKNFQAAEAGQRQLARQRRALHPGQDPVSGPEVVSAVRKIHFRFRVDRPQVREASDRWPLQSHQDRKSADAGHLIGGKSSRCRLPQPDVALGKAVILLLTGQARLSNVSLVSFTLITLVLVDGIRTLNKSFQKDH